MKDRTSIRKHFLDSSLFILAGLPARPLQSLASAYRARQMCLLHEVLGVHQDECTGSCADDPLLVLLYCEIALQKFIMHESSLL